MSVPQILDLIQTGGTLTFALLALYALISGRVQPRHVVEDKDRTIAYERAQKEAAFEVAREAIAAQHRLADAAEAQLRLAETQMRPDREPRTRR